MKKVYICGDSFGCSDPEYPGQSWSETLVKRLPVDMEVVNLSKVSASNLLISLQVERAVEQQADYVIFMGTSVLRDEVKLNQDGTSPLALVDRFVDIRSKNNHTDKDLISYTSLNINPDFLSESSKVLKDYSHMKDIELLIYENRCIIENSLQKLTDAGIPFVFDQGGFENPAYSTTTKEYFQKFKQNISKINLWSYVPVRQFRPYHHIVDEQLIELIADYYHGLIVNALAVD